MVTMIRRPRRAAHVVAQLVRFGWLEAKACAFAVAIVAGLALSTLVPLPVNRFDALAVYGVAVTLLFWFAGWDDRADTATILWFHLVGLGFELVKVTIGSWHYPDPGLLTIAGVPVFAGFMYAAVGSYVCRAWHLLDLRLGGYRPVATALVAVAVYANFLTSGWLVDVRSALAVLLVYVTTGTRVYFTVGAVRYRMPLIVSFVLIAVFLWIAENVSTFLGAWVYPHQAQSWQPVHLSKLWAWALLICVSFVLVASGRWRRSEPWPRG
ncbi:DUF817 domain-containing protein [Stackebrandtia soli]